ncbi:MAG: glycosyltransferase family 2 protein [Muribaculaceae bacterium]|nr:glycosyltransferase family 2 protein [Muribaculaceae bacterium]
MDNNRKITVIVHTYNAGATLARVLPTLTGFDEILVVDMESTDSTVDLARRYRARVVTFPRGEHRIVEPARQFGIDHASNPWVLEVDADELVTPELIRYLRELVSRPDAPDGLYIPRRNFFMGKEMKCGYPDMILRFFRRDRCTWPPEIHSVPRIDGRVDRIPASRRELAFIHLANESVHSRAAKHLTYSDYEADRKARRRRCPAFDLFWRPAYIFFRKYFLKGGWRDGRPGLVLSVQGACNEALICCKLIERRRTELPDPILRATVPMPPELPENADTE